MKKKLESELKNLATNILDTNSASSTASLKKMAKELYEKLTILAFTEDNLSNLKEEELEEPMKVSSPEKKEEIAPKQEVLTFQKDDYLPDGTEYNTNEAITEPNTEKIKDIVAQMPPETDHVDSLVESITNSNNGNFPENPSNFKKSDFRDIGVDYDNLPNFEPVKKQGQEKPRSLNDRLKKGINIGLNERLSFIKHLFDGHTNDYNRVISQLNTFEKKEDAHKFIQQVVKPDYKNWNGKEEYEERFMALVENKFNH